MVEINTAELGSNMANRKTGRLIGAIIVLVGAILLISAVFIPWYTLQVKTTTPVGSSTENQNSYPGLPSQTGTIQYTCSGGGSCPSSTSYSSAHENNTGAIAETGFFLLIVGFVIGLIGAILGVVWRGNARRVMPVFAFAIIAMILALITPVLFMATLPGAISKDIPAATKSVSSGPWSSFFGSTSYSPVSGYTINLTWGPAIGWYLAFAAFVILLIGVIFLFLNRREPAEPAPATVPAPAATPAPTPPAH